MDLRYQFYLAFRERFMSSIKNRIALITGEVREIEMQIARRLAQEGVNIALGFRDREQTKIADKLAASISTTYGVRAIAVRGDISKWGDVDDLIWAVESELGEVGILINNTATGSSTTPVAITREDWDQTLAANLTSAFLVAQRVLPGMRKAKFGRLIMMSPVATRASEVISPQLSASTAGLIGLMRYYATLFASEGVAANAVAMVLSKSDGPVSDANIVRWDQSCEAADIAVALTRNGSINGQIITVHSEPCSKLLSEF